MKASCIIDNHVLIKVMMFIPEFFPPPTSQVNLYARHCGICLKGPSAVTESAQILSSVPYIGGVHN